MSDFLDANYKMPEKGAYLKIPAGDTKIRILDKPIYGWLDWDSNNKPVRTKEEKKALGSVDKYGNPIKPRHFWAMVIWDYTAQTIKVWEITQKTFMDAIMNLNNTEEYGNPMGYDLKITRVGEGKDNTKYSLVAMPPKELSPEIEQHYKDNPVNLNALFEGGDPFQAEDLPF